MRTPYDGVNIRHFEDSDETAVIALARELLAHEHSRYHRMKPASEIGQ